MKEVWPIMLALSFPVVCLLMVLWLGRMEDNLVRDVRRARRQPEPPPILRIPSRAPVATQTSEVSRSAAASLGGSTNR